VEVARENAARNELAADVTVDSCRVDELGGSFEVVVANIEARTLIELASSLVPRLAPGGLLLLSGVLAPEQGEVIAAYEPLGMSRLATRSAAGDDPWRMLALSKVRAPVRLPLEALAAGQRLLEPDAGRYLTRVRRLVVGDRLLAFDPAARVEALAEVTATRPEVRLQLDAPRPASLIARRAVTLIQAAAKAAKLDDVVRDATELGATRVVIAAGRRSVKQPKRGKTLSRARRIAVEAARQCGRGDAPEIAFEGALDETFARYAPRGSRGICLHPAATSSFAEALAGLGQDEAVVLAVGPEGGFDLTEIEAALRAGFRLARLGRFVLRTETACAAALGALAALDETK
jgi:16S rRNA (uracil1498-N3)-methyltransferase